MNTCDTCNHWGEPRRSVGGTWPVCKCERFHSSLYDMTRDAADVELGHGGCPAVRIHPGPKFGCVHWEERESFGVRCVKGLL